MCVQHIAGIIMKFLGLPLDVWYSNKGGRFGDCLSFLLTPSSQLLTF